jgi:hypothetical protein
VTINDGGTLTAATASDLGVTVKLVRALQPGVYTATVHDVAKYSPSPDNQPFTIRIVKQ